MTRFKDEDYNTWSLTFDKNSDMISVNLVFAISMNELKEKKKMKQIIKKS